MNRSVLLYSLTLALFLASPAFGCLCPYAEATVEQRVKGEAEAATAIFVGKVLGYEYKPGILYSSQGVERGEAEQQGQETQLVKFEIERWWKMPLPSELLLITTNTRPIIKDDKDLLPRGIFFGCGAFLAPGKSFLVYAFGPAERLEYRACSRTTEVTKASEDLKILGKGNKPVKP